MPRSSWKPLAIAALALMVLALFALLAFGLANRSPATGRSGVTRIGKPAPRFVLPLLGVDEPEGVEFRLADHAGSPVVINFWASWCPPCRQESPAFERQWRRHRDAGAVFVGVDIQDSVEDAEAYIQEFDLTFPNARDPDGRVTIDYGVIGLPVTFFVSSEGVVEGRWVGAIPEDRLEAWVEALIAGTTPDEKAEGGRASDAFRKLP